MHVNLCLLSRFRMSYLMMMMMMMMMRFDSISFVAPLFRDKTLNLMFAVLSTNQTTNVGKP